MRTICFLTALVCVTVSAARGDDKEDRQQLQGTWKVVSMISDGKSAAADKIKTARLTFDGDRYSLKGGDEDFRGTFKLDASKNPKQIDTTFVGEDNKEKGKARGIYELDGKRLRVSWAHDKGTRPTNFSARSGTEERVMILERE